MALVKGVMTGILLDHATKWELKTLISMQHVNGVSVS